MPVVKAKFKVRHGLEKDLSNLEDRELGFTDDTKKVVLRVDEGNVELAKKEMVESVQTDLQGKINQVDEKTVGAITKAQDVENQFNRVVAEAGSNNPEVVQARGNEVNLNARLNKFTTDLADIATNVKSYGATGDGVTDDTTAILNCFQYCIANNKLAYFPYGTYVFSPANDFNCNGMLGQKAIIKYNSTKAFFLQNNTVIRDVEIKYSRSHIDGEAAKVFQIVNVSNISIENCKFVYDATKEDGLTLGIRVFRIEKSSKLFFNNLVFKNIWNGFSLFSSSNLKFNNIEFYNYSGGITVSDNIYDKAIWSNNIYIDNITAKNTKTQRANIFGWDSTYAALFAFYGAKDVYINNITSEYAIRRILYCSGGENINFNNATLKGLCSIKFVGFVARSYGKDTVSDGFVCNNIFATWDSDITDRSTFDFYFAKNIKLNNINVANCLNNNTVVLQSYVENLTIMDSSFETGKVFALVQLQNTREGDSTQGIPNVSYADYDAFIKKLLFKNVTIKNYNPNNYIFDITSDIPDTTLRFQNIEMNGVQVDNTNLSHKGTVVSPTYLCKGLFSIDKISGLKVANCVMDGYTNPSLRSIYVGSMSEKVRINHIDHIETGSNIVLTDFRNLFMSSNSEYGIRARVNDGTAPTKYFNFSIKPQSNSTLTTLNSLLNFVIEGEISYSMLAALTNGTSVFVIPYDSTWYSNAGLTRPKVLGTMEIIASDGDNGRIRINNQVSPFVTISADSVNIKNDYTVGFLTVSTNATSTIDIRDKDAVDRTVAIKYKLQTY